MLSLLVRRPHVEVLRCGPLGYFPENGPWSPPAPVIRARRHPPPRAATDDRW